MQKLFHVFVRSLISILAGVCAFGFTWLSSWLGQLTHVVKPFYWTLTWCGSFAVGIFVMLYVFVAWELEE